MSECDPPPASDFAQRVQRETSMTLILGAGCDSFPKSPVSNYMNRSTPRNRAGNHTAQNPPSRVE